MKKLVIVGFLTLLISLFSINAFAADQYSVARNQTTGEVCVYLMALNWVGQNKACFGVTDLNWEVISSSYDFDKNGQNDILWRHKPSGAFYVWKMKGLVYVGGAYVLEPLSQSWILK